MQDKINITLSRSTIFNFFFFFIMIYLFVFLWDVVLIFLTSIVIASFVESASNRLTKLKIPRTAAVVMVYALGVAILAGLFYALVPVLTGEVSSLIKSVSDFFPDSNIIQSINSVGDAKNAINDVSGGAPVAELVAGAKGFLDGVSGTFFGTVSFIFGGVVNLILIFIISFYLSVEERGIEKFLKIVTPLKKEAYVVDLWNRVERKISLWVQGQMVLGLIIGFLTFIGLLIIGVDYAFILALVAAVSELIPYGLILAIIPAVTLSFFDGGLTLMLVTGAFFIILQQLENYLIGPLIVRRATGVPPLVAILSLLIGAKLAGFWGLIIAIPVAVFLMEYMGDIEKKKESERDNV